MEKKEKKYSEKHTPDIAKKMDIALFINSYRTMVSPYSKKKKRTIVIETSNGLRCIRSHWQYYSRSTAPARQRKTKANCRRNRSKMASYKCCGTGPNQTTFSQTDCCKLPKEISGNKAGNGRKKKTTATVAALPRDTGAPILHAWPPSASLQHGSKDETIAAFQKHADSFQHASVANCASERLV